MPLLLTFRRVKVSSSDWVQCFESYCFDLDLLLSYVSEVQKDEVDQSLKEVLVELKEKMESVADKIDEVLG